MSLTHEDFERINAATLQALIDNAVPEGPMLEYKRDPYTRAPQDRREFLKDVTAFANASGGHLVIGVDEAEGVARAIAPIAGLDLDEEMRRMEQMLLNGVEPRTIGIRMRVIPVSGGHCIVLRIPGSWNPPHRVTTDGINRFYFRHTTNSAEMSVEELRVLFNRGATAQERAFEFRRERLALIEAGNTPVPIQVRPATLVLHIVPVLARQQVVFPNYHQNANLLRPWQPLRIQNGSTPRYNFEGLVIYDSTPLQSYYLQLFRTGAVEAVQSGIGAEHRLPAQHLERLLFDALPRLFTGLNNAEIAPPYAVMITLLRAQNLQLAGLYEGNRPFDRDIYELPPVIVNELGPNESYDAVLKPAVDAIWQAAGDYQSENFGPDGRWLLRR
jgi:hypothetical protein